MNAGYPWAPDEEAAVMLVWKAREAIIGRFDHQWRVWWRHLSDLVEEADEEELQRLEVRLRELLELEGLTPIDLIMLRKALAMVRREAWTRQRRRRRTTTKKRMGTRSLRTMKRGSA